MTMGMGLGPMEDISGAGSGYKAAAHPNPMFDYTTAFVPRKLKDLFKWAEYLGFNSAHVYGVVRKFGEYPITRFLYESRSVMEKDRHKKLFEDHLKFKGTLTLVSYDLWLYGNAFISVYEPIKRDLQCPYCGAREDIRAARYTFNLDKFVFKHDCRKCKVKGVHSKVIDEKLKLEEKIRIIRWDPKLIDIEHNRVTGESTYYYQIPRSDIQKVRAGNKGMINQMPIELLRAMQDAKTFKFKEEQLFHMKMPGPAGVESHWGFPPITSAIKNFLFAATLRRANEAIALEHITPFRILHPLAASGAGDPLTTINLGKWRAEMQQNIRLWRRDPLQIQFSPVPVGVQNVGGEGRALLVLGELQEAEKNIVLSLGVPMEFLSGGLGQTRGEITLRMIENQLQTHIENLNSLIQWVEMKCSAFLGWESIPMKLADFKMIDDEVSKQTKLQLWQAGKVSDTTVAEMFNLDLEHERKQRIQDELDNLRAEQELDLEKKRLQTSISQQAQQSALMGSIQGNDPQSVVARVDMLVQELAQYDPATRRSRMDGLKTENYLDYCVAKDRLEQLQQDQNAAMKAQGGAPQ